MTPLEERKLNHAIAWVERAVAKKQRDQPLLPGSDLIRLRRKAQVSGALFCALLLCLSLDLARFFQWLGVCSREHLIEDSSPLSVVLGLVCLSGFFISAYAQDHLDAFERFSVKSFEELLIFLRKKDISSSRYYAEIAQIEKAFARKNNRFLSWRESRYKSDFDAVRVSCIQYFFSWVMLASFLFIPLGLYINIDSAVLLSIWWAVPLLSATPIVCALSIFASRRGPRLMSIFDKTMPQTYEELLIRLKNNREKLAQ